jgi:uncharacterized protein YxeA
VDCLLLFIIIIVIIIIIIIIITIFTELTVEQLERCSDWFKEEEKFRVEESKRPGKGKHQREYPGIEDSTTRLDID